MSTPPVFRRFTISDFPTAPEWAGQMFNPLNTFCEQTVQCFSKQLEIGQNVQGQKYELLIGTPTDYATSLSINRLAMGYTGGGRPTCLMLGSVQDVSGVPITSPVSITRWYLSTDTSPFQLVVEGISGLTASKTYRATFIAF